MEKEEKFVSGSISEVLGGQYSLRGRSRARDQKIYMCAKLSGMRVYAKLSGTRVCAKLSGPRVFAENAPHARMDSAMERLLRVLSIETRNVRNGAGSAFPWHFQGTYSISLRRGRSQEDSTLPSDAISRFAPFLLRRNSKKKAC